MNENKTYILIGINVADHSYGLPDWASGYFNYEDFGEDLANNSDEYYVLDSGRIISYG